MRKHAFVALLCTAQLWAAPGLAMLTDPGKHLAPPALPDRHALSSPQGGTMWILLVDLALHCSGQTGVTKPVCYGASERALPGGLPLKLQ